MNLPIDNPVLIVALAMLVFLLVPLLFERIKLPGIVGLILAGAVIGPHTLGLLERDFTIQLLGTVGLLYLMFIAGLEIDLVSFAKNRQKSLIFGGISFSLPMVAAVLIMPYLGFSLMGSLLVGAVVASHTLLAYPTASRLGITKNLAVIAVVGGTIMTDTLSLGVLTAVASAAGGEGGWLLWLSLLFTLGLFVAFILWGLPSLGRWVFRHTDNQAATQFIFLMVALFGSAYLAEIAGAQSIIGAFLSGLTLNRLIPDTSPLMNRVKFVGNTLFVPFFLLSVGMLVDFRVLFGSTEVWLVAGVLIALVVIGKGAAAFIAGYIFGFSRPQTLVMAGLSIPQAAATLAVTFVGLELGLFSEAVVNAVIVLILVTCFVGPYLLELFGRAVAVEEEAAPYEPNEAPHRILVPLSNPATAEALMDLAFMLRTPNSPEPLFPLTVVPDTDDPTVGVVAAEKTLAHAVIHAAGADVPITPLTRVAQNPTSGMLRAVSEQRITDVIIGWNGQRGARQRIFGSVIDQFITQSQQLVIVTKLEQPLNTFKRLVVILPPLISHHPGYYQALRTIKLLTSRLGIKILGLVVAGNEARYLRDFKEVKPDADASFQTVANWSELYGVLETEIDKQDLPLVLSVRRGTLAWTAQLESLPQHLSPRNSFLMLYPPTLRSASNGVRDSRLPDPLSADRVRFNMPALEYESIVNELLAIVFEDDSPLRNKLLEALINDEVGFATEVLPSALVAHARSSGLKEAMMFLALSPEGFRNPRLSRPRHAVAILLSPAQDDPAQHLKRLDALGRLVGRTGDLQGLLSLRSYDELAAWAVRETTAEAPAPLQEAIVPDVLEPDAPEAVAASEEEVV